jgi:hypothetical protein
MSIACAAVANAQAVFDTDMTFDVPADENDEIGGEAVVISNATITIANPGVNNAAFPFKNGETVTLSDGGKVKFADDPDNDYANPEDYGFDLTYYEDVDGNQVTALPYNWVIEGTGNEIYLDSRCTFGGTIVGTGDVTIYVGNKDVIDFDCLNTEVESTTQFTGTIYFKTLDGYTCDTLTIGSNYPGHGSDGVSFVRTNVYYKAIPYSINVEGLNNPVLYSNHAFSAWPGIAGECSIYVGNNGYAFFRNSSPAVYDAEIFSDNSASRLFDIITGASTTFNRPIHGDWSFAYVRNAYPVIFNGQEPTLSGVKNRLSARASGGGTYAGTGYIDCSVEGKDGTTLNVAPGATGDNSIGTLTIKNLYLMNNNGLSIDFDGLTSDKIVLVDTAEFTGANTRVWLNLMENFLQNPKVGNYQVLDGTCVIGMQAVNDTVGYYVVDSCLTFVNVNTGDTITSFLKIFPNSPVNREIDTLAYWGLGTGTSQADYVSNPNKIDASTWASDYSSDARALIEAREFMPYTNDTIKYTGHTLTATDMPLLEAYDYIYNFNLVVKNNAMSLIQPNGDTLNIARDFFNFTFKGTDSIGNTVMRYVTQELPVAQANGDTINYWFDFSKFFTNGVIALCSEEYPTVDLTQEPVNGSVSGIGTINKEVKAVAARTIISLDGKRLNTYAKGLNIVKTRYTDGTVEVKKVFFRE